MPGANGPSQAAAGNLGTTFVPKVVGFPLILFTGWLIAKAVSKAWALVLSKIGFGKRIEKTGLTGTLGQAKVDAGVILVELLSYFILLIARDSRSANSVRAIRSARCPTTSSRSCRGSWWRGLPVPGALSTRPAERLLGTITYWEFMAFGFIAVLGQAHIATAVTGPVLGAVLATLGGGLIKPAPDRWQGRPIGMRGQADPGAGERGVRSEPPTSPVGIGRVDS